jgi:hypothetical protein
MEIWQGKTLGAYPKAVCAQCFDDARIHKNLSPFPLRQGYGGHVGLRIFLAQERIFLFRRIYPIRLLSEIPFELSKIFRNAPNVNF